MDSVRIFVISLIKSTNRRKAIANLFEHYKIDFEFIDAIEGASINREEVQKISDGASLLTNYFVNKMSANEVGCAYSHILAYKKIISEGISYAIVFEDDIAFDNEFKTLLNNLNNSKSTNNLYDLILLGYTPDLINHKKGAKIGLWNKKRIGKHVFGKPIIWYWCAYAYLLSNNGAKMLLDAAYPIRMPADILTTNCENYGLNMGIIKTPVVWIGPESDESTIGERPQSIVQNLQHSSKNLLARLINSNPATRNLKMFIYYLIASFNKKKVFFRMFSLNPCKFYIQKF